MKSVLAVLSCAYLAAALPPPHPDVLAVRHEESQLPPHLRSPALHNHHLQEILTLSSLLHKGEKLVFERDAHDVTRKDIYILLTHAGLVPRRHPHARADLHQPAVQTAETDVWNPPFLQTQDLLQHL